MWRMWAVAGLFVLTGTGWSEQKAAKPAITGISHMTLYADNVIKSQSFYADTLGWKQEPAGAANPGVRFYANHEQYVELVSPPDKDRINRLDGIGFITADAEGMRRYLAGHGIAVPQKLKPEPDGGWSFEVRDPEGNQVSFEQTGPHPPSAPAQKPVSGHIIHVGVVAHNRAVLDAFYRDLLGFHLYWQGGAKPGDIDWVMMQVPDGTDWVEYMLYLPATPSRGQLGSANHFAPGVASVNVLRQDLLSRGWKPAEHQGTPLLGVDGKWQLDLLDPDGTRAEFMEFEPAKTPCCSTYTSPQPHPSDTW